MRSKTSYFNKTLFFKNITGYWPIWAAYLLIWLLILPVNLGQSFANGWFSGSSDLYSLRSSLFSVSVGGSTIMSLIFGAFTAMAVFSYMYNQKSTGMMHSLPIKREGLFLTSYLSGLSFMIVPNVVVFIITLLVEAAYGAVDMGSLLTWLAVCSMLNVFFFSFAALCATFTGHVLVLPVVYGILNFVVVGAETLLMQIFRALSFGSAGYISYHNFLNWFSPPIKLMDSSYVTYGYAIPDSSPTSISFSGWGTMAVYLVAGLILAGVALLIYRRRRSEAAGDVVAARPLKPVFKYCMAFGFAVTLGLLLNEMFTGQSYGTEQAVIMLVCMLFAGVIGYYTAEMLMHKSFRVFKGSLPGLLCFFAVCFAFTFAVEFDVFGYERRVPDINKVESANVVMYNGYYVGSSPVASDIEGITELHSKIVSEKAELERASNEYNTQLRDTGSSYYYGGYYYDYTIDLYTMRTVNIHYTMTDGKTIMRRYDIPVSQELLSDPGSPAGMLQELLGSKEAIEARYAFTGELGDATIVGGYMYSNVGYEQRGYEGSFSQIEAQALHAALSADIEAGRLGKVSLLRDEAFYEETLDLYLEIEYTYTYISSEGDKETGVSTMAYLIKTGAEQTIAALRELEGFDESMLMTMAERYAELNAQAR